VIKVSDYATLPSLWWRRPWRTSSLMRASDRVQAVVGMFAIAVTLLAVPLAGAVGTEAYTAAVARIQAENATKVEVTATVTAEPEQISAGDPRGLSDAKFEAVVRWDHDGRFGKATVDVPAATEAGDEVSVWLGPDSKLTTPPPSPAAAANRGIGTGLVLLGVVWGGALLLVWGTGRLLDRLRGARLDQEWREFSRPIGQDS